MRVFFSWFLLAVFAIALHCQGENIDVNELAIRSLAPHDEQQLENKTNHPSVLKQATNDSQVTATRQGPCECADGICGCCSRILLSTFRQKACVNVTYEPEDFRFTANVIMNDRVLYTRSVSGKNPRPVCVPLPRIPVVRACVRFYNIYFQGRNVHACVNMEGKFQDTTLFKVGFDCLRLGSNGVAVLKPEDGGGLGLQLLPDDDDDEDDDGADNDEYEGGDDDDDDDDDDDEGLFDY